MLTAIEGDVDAAVVAVDEVHRVGRVEPDVVVVDVDVVLGNGRPRGAAIGAFQQRHSPDDDVGLVGGVDFNQPEVVAVAVADFVEALLVCADPSSICGIDAARGGFPGAQGLGGPAVDLRPDDGRIEHLGVGVPEVIGEGLGIEVAIGHPLEEGSGVGILWESVVLEEGGQ